MAQQNRDRIIKIITFIFADSYNFSINTTQNSDSNFKIIVSNYTNFLTSSYIKSDKFHINSLLFIKENDCTKLIFHNRILLIPNGYENKENNIQIFNKVNI